MEDSQIPDSVNFLTKRLNDEYERGRKLPRNTTQSIKQYNDQVKFEAQYLISSRICTQSGDNSLLGISNADISGIKKDVIIHKLDNNFYDYYLMEEVRCMLNTILDISDGSESERQRINAYFHGMKRFGTPSAHNYALKGDIREQNSLKRKKHETYIGDMVVIKCPREPAGSRELIHERVVGDHLNRLRQFIPNFSYVYDAFTCSGTTVNNTTKEVIDFCTSDVNPVAYVMYENIKNAIPIDDLPKGEYPTKESQIELAKNFFRYLMQTAISLNLAERMCGFAHCDLHTDNLLLRKVSDKPFAILYSHAGRDVYVLSPGSIATFIDYGMSHIKAQYDENNLIDLGKLDSSGFFENIGISAKNTSVMADLYKLICFFIRQCIYEDKITTVLEISSILAGYFYSEESLSESAIVNIIIKQFEQRYHVPYDIVMENGWNVVDFIEYLDGLFEQLYGEKLLLDEVPVDKDFNRYPLFGCFEDCKLDEPEQIRDELNIHIAEVPTLEVFVLNPNNAEVKKRVEANFNTVIGNERIEASKEINSNHHRGFVVMSSDENVALSQIPILTESIQDLNVLAGIVLKLYNRIKKYNFCLDKFGDPNLPKENPKSSDKYNKILKRLIAECTDAYGKNLEYINRIKSSIANNYLSIQNFIFGEFRNTPLSEDEVSIYTKSKFYDLYTKYRSTAVLFEQVNIQL